MLKFNHVFFKYPNTADDVLKDISFEVKKGEWLSIIGSNGSGKSTISKLISAQYEKNKGEIRLADKDYTLDNLDFIREQVGIVFQNPDNQFVGASVEEDVAFGLENRNIKPEKMKAIIRDVLEKVDMLDYLKKEPTNLSGGQKQRVAIASTLALKPSILVLDEATAMLDPAARKKIMSTIKTLAKENQMTVISITHDIEELIYSDTVMLLEKGEIIGKFLPEEILSNHDLLNQYHIDIPFDYQLKQDLNQLMTNHQFSYADNLDTVGEVLCKYLLKK